MRIAQQSLGRPPVEDSLRALRLRIETRATKGLAAFALAAGFLGLFASAPARAANINLVQVTVNSGCWNTFGTCSILGATAPGGSINPFLNTNGSQISIANGTYLAFLGNEAYWSTSVAPGDAVTLFVQFDNSTSLQESFSFAALTSGSAASWNRTSGATTLFLGSSGVTTVDRIGNGLNAFSANGTNDVVLEFSTTGNFAGTAPEPSSWLLLVGGGLALALGRRRLSTLSVARASTSLGDFSKAIRSV